MAAVTSILKFGPFELRPGTGELWNEGRPLKLAPQPFQVLSLIVQGAGTLVTRDELRAAVWADGTTVEFDQGLNYCVRQIRLALKDDARNPVYVETIPKRGYRLLLPVVSANTQVATAVPQRVRRRMFTWGAVAAAALLATWMGHRQTVPAPSIDADTHRLFIEAEHLVETWE